MKPDEILIAKTAPAFTAEPTWWRFCVKDNGEFQYEKSSWTEKDGEQTEAGSGRLDKSELKRIRKIINSLDEIEVAGYIVEDAGTITIDYRRADKSTGSVEKHGEPVDDDAVQDDLDVAWLAVKSIFANHVG